MASEASQSEIGWVRWAPAAMLAGVAILALALQIFAFVDPTNPEDWQAASKDVIARVSSDDTRVRVHPTWNDSALIHLTEIGDQVDRKRTLIAEDLVGVNSWVVMAEVGRRDEALEAFPSNVEAREVRDFGSVETFVVEPEPVVTSFNLRDRLADAKVSRVRGDSVTRCSTWNEGERRWDCQKRDRWLYVADELREVGDEPRRCIYAHPLGGDTTLRFVWSDVELGEVFRLRSGIDLRAARAQRGDAVAIRLYIGDEEAVVREVAHRSEEWFLDSVKTRSGRTADVKVEIDTGDRFERYFCFDGWVLEETID